MTSPRRALIVVDVQQEYFSGPLEIQYPPRAEALAAVVRAIGTAQEHGLPIALAQHAMPEGAPVFVPGSPGYQLHPQIEALAEGTKRFQKSYGSVFAGTGLHAWLQENDVDTITLAGFMTNNCDLASAVEAEGLGVDVEILSDASGAIHLANEAGHVSAQDLHSTLMTLFNSNFAAVAATAQWEQAVAAGTALAKDNLVASALAGRQKFGS